MNPVRGGQGPEVLLSLLPRRQTTDYTAFTSEKPLLGAGVVACRQVAGSGGRAALKAAIWARISR